MKNNRSLDPILQHTTTRNRCTMFKYKVFSHLEASLSHAILQSMAEHATAVKEHGSTIPLGHLEPQGLDDFIQKELPASMILIPDTSRQSYMRLVSDANVYHHTSPPDENSGYHLKVSVLICLENVGSTSYAIHLDPAEKVSVRIGELSCVMHSCSLRVRSRSRQDSFQVVGEFPYALRDPGYQPIERISYDGPVPVDIYLGTCSSVFSRHSGVNFAVVERMRMTSFVPGEVIYPSQYLYINDGIFEVCVHERVSIDADSAEEDDDDEIGYPSDYRSFDGEEHLITQDLCQIITRDRVISLIPRGSVPNLNPYDDLHHVAHHHLNFINSRCEESFIVCHKPDTVPSNRYATVRDIIFLVSVVTHRLARTGRTHRVDVSVVNESGLSARHHVYRTRLFYGVMVS
ncbi:hypothetical protein KM540_gp016 [Western grey kangaroopox virus]|uniref:Uncharacterized protein n=1 Tax=Western grey kangaroopox virus TaxID=1566307 RepID=A0A2C9DSG4_9POXV|nr:hypothetical protein KM540_gp016 [Western grey kangaroopox virus]ATI20947.1 hypothetical protein [Western grey kangaroopox virus]